MARPVRQQIIVVATPPPKHRIRVQAQLVAREDVQRYESTLNQRTSRAFLCILCIIAIFRHSSNGWRLTDERRRIDINGPTTAAQLRAFLQPPTSVAYVGKGW
jgi:hypothetical protein